MKSTSPKSKKNKESETSSEAKKQQQPTSKLKFRSSYGEKIPHGETPEGISLTQPDMSLTVRDLILNHTRGTIDMDVIAKKPTYLEDTEIPTIQDISELEEHRENLEEQARLIEQQIELQKESEYNKGLDIKPSTPQEAFKQPSNELKSENDTNP